MFLGSGLVGGCASVLVGSCCCVCGDDLVCSGLCLGLVGMLCWYLFVWCVCHGLSLVFSLGIDG